ncbi:polymorphic toxin type 15 domain-containing protein [Aestuariimicrobium soli]|uniref:polymorphic toxin type 15 domain-containing protein n=1 Tax=Aestuariimicrobium soli TaxID=2035834 RepID=UPI003EBB1F19
MAVKVKPSKAMRGIFAEMLDDYLRVAAKSADKGIAKGGREAAQGAAKAAAKPVKVDFKLTERMAGHSAEMRRQLQRQLDAIGDVSPKELLDRLNNPAVRDGVAQREARKAFTDQMTTQQRKQMQALAMRDPAELARQLDTFNLTSTGNPFKDADALAKARTDGFMRTVAALHEPDIVAGGLDRIGRNGNWDSFGASNVNSSIGSQWKNLKPDLIRQLESLPPNDPIRLTFDF